MCGGVSFAEAEIRFFDNSNQPYNVCALVMLDTIEEEKGRLCPHKAAAMYAEVMQKNPVFRESKMPWDDKFIGAMRLRHGYGMTCHKSQGSEWNHVMLHNWFKPDDNRWLYTAITRAKKELYLRA